MTYFIAQMLNSLIYFTQSFLVKNTDKENWREDQDDREEETLLVSIEDWICFGQ